MMKDVSHLTDVQENAEMMQVIYNITNYVVPYEH